MKSHDLCVSPNTRFKALRTKAHRSKPKASKPNEYWGIDMTKIMTGTGWAYVVIVLDWYTKKVVGHYVGDQSKTWHWLVALNKAVNRQFPGGIKDQDQYPKLISDNGCQPTSIGFMKTCSDLNIEQIFTSYNNPKGNADTERFMRTLKEEKAWLQEWSSHSHLEKQLTHWIEIDYNQKYLHSSLGYKTPETFEINHLNLQNYLLKNAC